MPYFVVDGNSVYDRLREPRFHLLAFSNEQGEVESLKAQVEKGLFDFHEFQLTSEVKETFGADRPFHILLRPDNYIAFISAQATAIDIENYLATQGT